MPYIHHSTMHTYINKYIHIFMCCLFCRFNLSSASHLLSQSSSWEGRTLCATPFAISKITIWGILCKMELDIHFQISKHELKPVFIGFYTSKVSENSAYYASASGLHFVLRHKMRNFVLEKQIVTHVTKECDTNDTAFLEISLLNCIFSPKHWYIVVGRSFLKANNVLPFW